MVSEREKIIGARLRAFRETLQIPRAKFAVAIGFGSERIASIEAGRAPLRYEVFQAVSHRYQLSPYWLAEGAGSPKHGGAFDETRLAKEVHPRALFSEAYAKFIGGDLTQLQTQTSKMWQKLKLELSKVEAFLELTMGDDLVRERYKPAVARQLRAIESLATKMRADLRFRRAVRSKLQKTEKRLLTEVTPERNVTGVTEIALLLQRLKRALEGVRKGDLARSLKVPLPRVSEWLSGRVMPSGETTLRLLHWVEQREQKPNTPGSAINTTKGKTQLGKYSYEKPKSGPKRQ
jgi:transcriptional regulator with XRE-family HTH domain